VKLLTNPILVRMAFVGGLSAFSFVLGWVLIRRMRRGFSEVSLTPSTASAESFPLHTYHAVIQQLKQQKHELLSEQQADRRRAKTSENISAAVLSNLSSGVMFITPGGLVRQANAAAKQILGFASPLGMSAEQIFRQATVASPSGAQNLAEAIETSLREKTPFRRVQAEYATPSGEQRVLDISFTWVHAPSADLIGAACLINDQTEIWEIRRQQELRGEMSSEMALELRNSLTTISGYAQQLAASRDPELARQLASDIAVEATHLDRTIGGFLVAASATRAAAGA
jgi:nitrogen fixation/metabolism regulation signal transduction histidine kinase